MPREYKSEKSGMRIRDHRDDVISNSRAEIDRIRSLRTALNADGLTRLAYKGIEQREKAEELIPSVIFDEKYQKALENYFNRFLIMIAQYQVGIKKFCPPNGWREIFEGERSSANEKMQYYFESSLDVSQPLYYRGRIKKEPLQPIDTTDQREKLNDLLTKTNENNQPILDPKSIVLVSDDQLKQRIYFVDSRLQGDLLDLFGISFDKSGNMIEDDHPLLYHEALFNLDQPPFIIPFKQLEYGKPEAILPHEAGIFDENIKIAEKIFGINKN